MKKPINVNKNKVICIQIKHTNNLVFKGRSQVLTVHAH